MLQQIVKGTQKKTTNKQTKQNKPKQIQSKPSDSCFIDQNNVLTSLIHILNIARLLKIIDPRVSVKIQCHFEFFGNLLQDAYLILQKRFNKNRLGI